MNDAGLTGNQVALARAVRQARLQQIEGELGLLQRLSRDAGERRDWAMCDRLEAKHAQLVLERATLMGLEAHGRHGEAREPANSYIGPDRASSGPPDVTEKLKATVDPETGGISAPALSGDVGYNLAADGRYFLPVGVLATIHTGVNVQIPRGYFGLIVPRSRANSRGLDVRTSVIDQGYRGELMVMVVNQSHSGMHVLKGESLAQLILLPSYTPDIEVVDKLEESERGERGFGSTGA